MKRALYYKFTQNKHCRQTLLDTKDAYLQEDSPNDTYWGIGTKKDGKNKLGIFLMELRLHLKDGTKWKEIDENEWKFD